MIQLLVVAHERLIVSSAASLDELRAECNHSRKHLSRLLRLATLASDVVAVILDGRQPAQLCRIALLEADHLPIGWYVQCARLGVTAAA